VENNPKKIFYESFPLITFSLSATRRERRRKKKEGEGEGNRAIGKDNAVEGKS
jgi:hypothetical protein